MHAWPFSSSANLVVGLIIGVIPDKWTGPVRCDIGVLLDGEVVHRQPHQHAHDFQVSLRSFVMQLTGISPGPHALQAVVWDEHGTQLPNSGEVRDFTVKAQNKRFIYMVQSHTEVDVSDRVSADSDVVQLIWGKILWENPPWYQVWAPNTTANTGRNQVLAEAQNLGDYLYYIQCDDDAEVVEALDYGINTGHPWRTFEAYLRKYEPAVGFVRNDDYSDSFPNEVSLKANFDTILTAYHREAIDWLMPLETQWDNISWWYASCPLWLVARKFWPEHRLQFNALQVWNGAHTTYPKSNNWTIPIRFMIPALKMPDLITMDFNERLLNASMLGKDVQPKMRKGRYTPNDEDYDPCHPFFVDKRQGSMFTPNGARVHCPVPYTNDYMHFLREKEAQAFSSKLVAQQAKRITQLEDLINDMQVHIAALSNAVLQVAPSVDLTELQCSSDSR